jgi:hypothetical protein
MMYMHRLFARKKEVYIAKNTHETGNVHRYDLSVPGCRNVYFGWPGSCSECSGLQEVPPLVCAGTTHFLKNAPEYGSSF